MPFAEAAEQARIVAEVEAPFAELDEAEAALGRAEYRANLLRAGAHTPHLDLAVLPGGRATAGTR